MQWGLTNIADTFVADGQKMFALDLPFNWQ